MTTESFSLWRERKTKKWIEQVNDVTRSNREGVGHSPNNSGCRLSDGERYYIFLCFLVVCVIGLKTFLLCSPSGKTLWFRFRWVCLSRSPYASTIVTRPWLVSLRSIYSKQIWWSRKYICCE
jgi:hypothetical protein